MKWDDDKTFRCRNRRYPKEVVRNGEIINVRNTVLAKPCDTVSECLDDEDEAYCEADFNYSNGKKKDCRANYSIFLNTKCVQLSWQLSWRCQFPLQTFSCRF